MRILFLIALLCHSSPGAAQWHKVNSGTVADIVDMVFTDSLNGYAIAEKGTIIKTIDGGENWSFFYKDTTLYHQNSIVATDDSVFCFGKGFFGGDYKLSFRLGDSSFSVQPINFINSSMRDPVFWHHKIYYVDGGRLCTYDNYIINNILSGPEWFNIQGDYISASIPTTLYFSDDYGQSWDTSQFTTNVLSSSPYQSFYNGSDTLIAITHYPAMTHYSFDRGATWNSKFQALEGIHYFTFDRRVFGDGGITRSNFIFSSMYLFQSSSQDIFPFYKIDTLSDTLNNIYILDTAVIFAVGENGMIYKTTDGGGITGIKETGALKKRILIYPNPAKNSITLKIEENIIIQSVCLIDINGRLIKEQKGNLRSFSTENIPAGNYLLEVQTNKGVFTKKVIIQK